MKFSDISFLFMHEIIVQTFCMNRVPSTHNLSPKIAPVFDKIEFSHFRREEELLYVFKSRSCKNKNH